MKFLITAFLLITSSAFAQETSEYEWIQYGNDNQLLARATTIAKDCPLIKVNDEQFKMHFRAEQDDLELKEKVRICEYNVTIANKVSIRNKQLKLPPKQVNRFIVIGDSGCEASFFNSKHMNQECNNKAWPFEAIANKIALLNPDFVIHLGDYAYKNKYTTQEDAIRNQKMQWFFFKNEFFKPAKNLLNKVPMIFIRGNHESCALMGKAWFLFLDPHHYNEECAQQSSTYNLQINDLNLIVFDSSGAKSGKDYPEAQFEEYKAEFAHIAKNLQQPAWLLIHAPILGLDKLSDEETFNAKINVPMLNKAFGNDLTKKIPLAISGHFHIAAHIKRQSDNFEQFILGNGGTLIHRAKHNSYPYNADDVKGIVGIKYGYTQFDRIDQHKWKATSYTLDGSVMFANEVSTK